LKIIAKIRRAAANPEIADFIRRAVRLFVVSERANHFQSATGRLLRQYENNYGREYFSPQKFATKRLPNVFASIQLKER
jgi:hypothetical protein